MAEIRIQAEKECRRAHFWVLVAPERHVLYRYTSRHDSEATGRLRLGWGRSPRPRSPSLEE